MPRKCLTDYDVYVVYRNKREATNAKQTLGLDKIPETFTFRDKTFYWSGLDEVLGSIVFSEVDPRVNT